MNCKISAAKLFLFLLLISLVSCNEPEEVVQDKLVKKVIEQKSQLVPKKNKETKIDSMDRALMGAWVNIEYLQYLDKYGTAHQAIKEINDILALSIDYRARKRNRFSIHYIPTKHGGEPFDTYLDLDSVVHKNGYQLLDYYSKKEERFLKWKNDTLQILEKSSKGWQKTYFKRVLIQEPSNYMSSFDGIRIANRKLLANLSFELFSAEQKRISSKVTFDSEGQVLNWAPYESFSLSAYHASQYLSYDKLQLRSDKEDKSIVFYVEKKGRKWMLYEQGSVQFVREEVPTRGKLLFILQENNVHKEF